MFLITETHQAPQAPLPVTPDCNFKNAGPVLRLSSLAPPPSPAKQSGNQARPSCLVEISSLLGIAGRACLGAPRRCSWVRLVGLRCGRTPRCSRSWLPTPQAAGTKAAVLCNQGKLSAFLLALPPGVHQRQRGKNNSVEVRLQDLPRSTQHHSFSGRKLFALVSGPFDGLPGASLVSSLVAKRSRGLK